MKRIRESLEYPIPFWLSPIFLLSLIGFWLIFKWGFESTPDKWEYWKWVIERVIYIGTVIGAAYWAQSIFNNNALKRENRERRLAKLDLMASHLLKIKDDMNQLKSMKKDLVGNSRAVIANLSDYGYSSVNYFEELADAPLKIMEELASVLTHYENTLEEYVLNNIPANKENLQKLRESQPSLEEVLGKDALETAMNLLFKAKLNILKVHQQVEEGKYNT